MTLADPTPSTAGFAGSTASPRLFEKHSPVTGASLGQFPIADSEAVDAAVARARAAFPGWRDTPLAVRLEELAGRQVVAVAGGRDKPRAIAAVLQSGLITGLITDEATAREVVAFGPATAVRPGMHDQSKAATGSAGHA